MHCFKTLGLGKVLLPSVIVARADYYPRCLGCVWWGALLKNVHSELSSEYRCMWLHMCVLMCACVEQSLGQMFTMVFLRGWDFFQELSLYKSHMVVIFCFFKKNNVFVITQ